MKKYLPFFSKYKKALILAPVLVIIDVICEIVQPELMSKIVDIGVSPKKYGLHLSYRRYYGDVVTGGYRCQCWQYLLLVPCIGWFSCRTAEGDTLNP